jgi:hypothetical protein
MGCGDSTALVCLGTWPVQRTARVGRSPARAPGSAFLTGSRNLYLDDGVIPLALSGHRADMDRSPSRARVRSGDGPSRADRQDRRKDISRTANSRRRALLLLLCGTAGLSALDPAVAAENPAVTRGLSVYVKKKKLDKIDSYLPPLFLAREQLIRVIRIVQEPADARQQLRSGSFSGLRENVRSVGEYVSREKKDEQLGKKLVGEFFAQLEAADFALLSASRSEDDKRRAEIQDARGRLDGTIKALDALIAELPKDVVDTARGIADAVDSLDQEAALDINQRGEASRLEKLL